jgi:hypothetical protein
MTTVLAWLFLAALIYLVVACFADANDSRNERRAGVVRPSRDSQPGHRPSTGSGLATKPRK